MCATGVRCACVHVCMCVVHRAWTCCTWVCCAWAYCGVLLWRLLARSNVLGRVRCMRCEIYKFRTITRVQLGMHGLCPSPTLPRCNRCFLCLQKIEIIQRVFVQNESLAEHSSVSKCTCSANRVARSKSPDFKAWSKYALKTDDCCYS